MKKKQRIFYYYARKKRHLEGTEKKAQSILVNERERQKGWVKL
jgi:hypothetical protein